MACDLWREKLDAFVDAELPAGLPENDQREFNAHLRGCTSCATEIAARAQMKIAVRNAAQRRYAPSAEFRKKIERQILPQKRRQPFAWVWAPAIGVVVIVLVAALWLALPARNASSATFGEVVDLHVAALASANPVDVISTDLHTVKPWFEGKVPFAVNLPNLTNTPFTLLGGRVAYLDQTAGAGLLFQYRKHRLSVFIFQDRAAWKKMDTNGSPKQHASLWVETWSEDGLRYFVIGDTSDANVAQLSRLMRGASAPSVRE